MSIDFEALKKKLATPGSTGHTMTHTESHGGVHGVKMPEHKTVIHEPVKPVIKPLSPEHAEAARILKENGNQESNIPLNSPYWGLRP